MQPNLHWKQGITTHNKLHIEYSQPITRAQLPISWAKHTLLSSSPHLTGPLTPLKQTQPQLPMEFETYEICGSCYNDAARS